MTPHIELVDPPIAKAARVRGPVVALVTFAMDGKVSSARIVSGPVMLQANTLQWVRQLIANPYSGSRECPITVEFLSDPNPERACDSAPGKQIPVPAGLQTIDLQHYSITSEHGCLVTNYASSPHA